MSAALDHVDLHQVLSLDIETVPVAGTFAALSPRLQDHWRQRAEWRYRGSNEPPEALFEANGGLYAEFGRVVCISVGLLRDEGGNREKLYLKSFANTDEATLLRAFVDFLNDVSQRPDEPQRGRRRVRWLCAHNGCEFDFPYLGRRLLVNGIRIPELLQLQGKKPWEVPHLDTMQLWTFGDRKNFTRLDLLAELFGIPSPKDDIDGSDIRRVFYEEQDLPRIVHYCQKDVVTVVRVLQHMLFRPQIAESDIAIID